MPHDPSSHPFVGRTAKESSLNQRGHAVWLFGLSGSGKTTLAGLVERALFDRGHVVVTLDGDDMRAGLNSDLGFGDDSRRENIRRLGEVARHLVAQGIVVIVSAITPQEDMRGVLKKSLAGDLLLVYIEASFETCARRDVKGLYAKAMKGDLPNFTGKDSGFDPPAAADLILNTEAASPEESAAALLAVVLPRVTFAAP